MYNVPLEIAKILGMKSKRFFCWFQWLWDIGIYVYNKVYKILSQFMTLNTAITI